MEDLKKLYDVLIRDGYYTKSYEDFQVSFESPEYQDKVYGVVSRDGLFTKDKETFLNKYSVKKKDDSDSPLISPEGDTESSSTTETEDVSLASGQTPRELSFIEQQGS